MNKKVKTVRFGPFEGRGRTLTTARVDACGKALYALSLDYGAHAISLGGETAIVYRTPEGVVSAIQPRDDGLQGHKRSCETFHGPLESLREAVEAVASHLAQRHYDPAAHNVAECVRVFYADDVLVFEHAERAFRVWSEWQQRYRRLRAAGCDDATARERA